MVEKLKKYWGWIIKIYHSPGNIPIILYRAFFTNGKGFTTKKFWAFVFCITAAYDDISLVFGSEAGLDLWLFTWKWGQHWTIGLTKAGVSSGVQIALISAHNLLALGALTVYGWAKIRENEE